MVRALCAALLPVAFAACAYVLPASWRAFRADPDDAAPAITRALDAQNMSVANWDQTHHKITTNWISMSSGLTRTRERFVISWERDPKDRVLTIYVRHEAQDEEEGEGRPGWGAVYHTSSRENGLLDKIAEELGGKKSS
jgi:hypothetical protein